MAKTKTIGVTISEDTAATLKRHAEVQRRSTSNLAAAIIAGWVAEQINPARADAKEMPE
jgi:flagellar basal body L-ring protein FlgH